MLNGKSKRIPCGDSIELAEVLPKIPVHRDCEESSIFVFIRCSMFSVRCWTFLFRKSWLRCQGPARANHIPAETVTDAIQGRHELLLLLLFFSALRKQLHLSRRKHQPVEHQTHMPDTHPAGPRQKQYLSGQSEKRQVVGSCRFGGERRERRIPSE